MTSLTGRRALLALGGAFSMSSALRAQDGATRRIDFETTDVGALPEGFTTGLTGGGGPVDWRVLDDPSAPAGSKVLAQISTDATDDRFPLAILDQSRLANLDVAVKFKAVAGKVDRAAGLAVRLVDAANYYVVRANALEDNVRLYRVVRGRRTQFAGANARVPSGSWQELRLRVRDSRFEVLLDGKSLFSATDTTFAAAGRVALWTKADSVTSFDDLAIQPLG